MEYKVFVVEDDPGIAEGIAACGASWGFETRVCADLRHVAEEFSAYQPHIVLMDIGLPYRNGYYWCQEIRKVSSVPILFLSSASDNLNIVMAMNMGGDDFIAKPFDVSVLVAKARALLRRSYDYAAASPVLSHNGAFLHTGDQTLLFEGQRIPLTRNEYRILQCLMENKGRIVSRERLMEALWESEAFVDDNTLSVNVNRLRKKLEGAGLKAFIGTKVGVGYIVE